MNEKRIRIKTKDFKNQFGFRGKDYRATVGSLKEVLENFDDDLPIGVLYDGELAYCDIYQIFIGEDGIVRLVGD